MRKTMEVKKLLLKCDKTDSCGQFYQPMGVISFTNKITPNLTRTHNWKLQLTFLFYPLPDVTVKSAQIYWHKSCS